MSPDGDINTHGGVAQLGEHLPCKQGVKGSIPFISTTWIEENRKKDAAHYALKFGESNGRVVNDSPGGTQPPKNASIFGDPKRARPDC